MILDLSHARWHNQLAHLEVSPSISTAQWLSKPYVLGKALERAHGSIQVKVLLEGFELPFQHERMLFQERDQNAPFYVREIFLKNEDKVLTYGRVVIPEVTFLKHKAKFLELKDKSIGKHILYAHPNCSRSEFKYAAIVYNTNPLWGRRSVFFLDCDPLLVTEFYMTDLGPYPE